MNVLTTARGLWSEIRRPISVDFLSFEQMRTGILIRFHLDDKARMSACSIYKKLKGVNAGFIYILFALSAPAELKWDATTLIRTAKIDELKIEAPFTFIQRCPAQ